MDFEYFENIAALLECDEDISYDDMFELISQVDTETLIMLIDNYFEEISDYIPGESAEFYTLMEQIRLSLTGLARSSDEACGRDRSFQKMVFIRVKSNMHLDRKCI